ncbi:hypothetical protein [Sporolactobacillus sp. KGMB 08714]|uniref:hypothetical protein n=1 Tax=Sporolactobacillus sp. KGMB 08714 TaxID=3064704 RepID=UPI002FBDDC97
MFTGEAGLLKRFAARTALYLDSAAPDAAFSGFSGVKIRDEFNLKRYRILRFPFKQYLQIFRVFQPWTGTHMIYCK